MALNTFECYYLTPLHFKELTCLLMPLCICIHRWPAAIKAPSRLYYPTSYSICSVTQYSL